MAARDTMNISLTAELRKFVSSKVGSGRYTSASEVVREALRLLERTEKEHKSALQDVRAQIATGLVQLDRGDTFDGEAVFREIQQLSRARRRRKAG
jgi:antitoxin ParD1/3/4